MNVTSDSSRKVVGKGLQRFMRLLPIVLLLWVYLLVRWHEIAAHFPIFIDEIHHIRRARAVWAFNDLHTSTTPGKFLLYYWIGIFGLPEFPPLALVRMAAALLTIVGAAGAFALAKLLFKRTAGLLALVVVTFFPFILFYERMALTDSLAASLAVLVAWWSVVVARQPSLKNANILALFYCLMMAAKILAFPLTIMPFVAVLMFAKEPFAFNKAWRDELKRLWQVYRPAIVRVIVIVAIVWGGLIGFYQTRKILDPNTRALVDDYLYSGVSAHVTGTDAGKSQLSINLGRVQEVFQYLWGDVLMALAVLATLILVWKRWRAALFLLSGILTLWAFVIIVAGQLNSRYLTLVAQLCVVVIVGGIVVLQDEIDRRLPHSPLRWVAWLPSVVLLGWVVSFGVPFARTAMRDPVALALPDRDKSEYFRNYTGYALPEALAFVAESPPISSNETKPVVVSWARVCEFLPYHTPEAIRGDFVLICPPEGQTETYLLRFDLLNGALQEYGAVYLLVEQFRTEDGGVIVDPAFIEGEVELLASFPRPHDGVLVEVYEVRGALAQ